MATERWEIAQNMWTAVCKVELSVYKKVAFICFNKNALKMMENAFYFMLKALLVLEIFTFLSWIFSYVEKQLDKKA